MDPNLFLRSNLFCVFKIQHGSNQQNKHSYKKNPSISFGQRNPHFSVLIPPLLSTNLSCSKGKQRVASTTLRGFWDDAGTGRCSREWNCLLLAFELRSMAMTIILRDMELGADGKGREGTGRRHVDGAMQREALSESCNRGRSFSVSW